ncbi:hypothetical protein [Pseudomonas sp. B11(2017)]|uniref:hypothetical protein n=1 Tax=Pseudomonas sp. B11(2017) TaxID=1981748 RepID=UPI000A1FFA67|nr:hypothetical protein [Pseudomonas sp. B11(2017)]
MEFLRLLVFLAAWGFMWRWVVKNRGGWNLFYSNLVGAAGGFIVGLVMLSITFSLFPSPHRAERAAPEEVVEQEAESVSDVALLPEADDLPAYVAGEPQNEPSPPESALLPNFSNRLTAAVSEKKVQDTAGKEFAALRKRIDKDPNADKSLLASVMCAPFIMNAMRFPASAVIANPSSTQSTRYKDQTYTISNTVTARNMLGDDVSYRYDCSLQQVAGKESGYADWRLLNLKLQKVKS